MTFRLKLTNQLAMTILAEDGISAVWNLHLAAAEAYQSGYDSAANAIVEIAEAAEEAWLRAEGERVLVSVPARVAPEWIFLTGVAQPANQRRLYSREFLHDSCDPSRLVRHRSRARHLFQALTKRREG
jgi:hypothetical protein